VFSSDDFITRVTGPCRECIVYENKPPVAHAPEAMSIGDSWKAARTGFRFASAVCARLRSVLSMMLARTRFCPPPAGAAAALQLDEFAVRCR